MRRLLAIPDARRYLAGQACSLLGDSALVLVLMIWVKELTGSSSAAGMVVFAFAAATLLAPLAGVLVDRVRRRPLLIVANLLSALAVLPLLLVDARADLWLIYVVAALYGLSYAVIGAGQSALLATLLPAELLAEANGALQTIREGLRLVAPLAGAALFAAFGATPVVLLDAATFVVAALALAAMRLREPRPRPRGERPLAELVAGARHIAGARDLRRMVLAVATACLVIGFCESVFFDVVALGLDRPATFLGVVMVVQGVGAVVGGLTAGRVEPRLGEARLTGLGLVAIAGGSVLQATASPAIIFAGVMLFGFGIPWVLVGQVTLVQRRTPIDLQGRAFGAVETLTGGPQTASIVVGAALVAIVDYRLLLGVVAAVMAVAAASLLVPGRSVARAAPARSGPRRLGMRSPGSAG